MLLLLIHQQTELLKDIIGRIPDPEIPVITIADLGILRNVEVKNEKVIVTITPTYSGCPAMKAIEQDIAEVLRENNYLDFEIRYTYSPAWTTEWMTEEAKNKLREYGIAPPQPKAKIACPRCGSQNIEMISMFASTACKSLYRCLDCREPFDYFKCH